VEATRGRQPEARRAYHLARKVFQELAARDPDNLAYLRQLSLTEHNLAMVESPGEKLTVLRSARAHRERAVAVTSGATNTQHDLARTDEILGLTLWSQGQRAEAIQCLQQAASTLEEVVRRDPHVTQFRRSLAETYLNLGACYGELKQLPRALAAFEKARAALEEALHQEPTNSVALDELGLVYQNISEAYRASEQPVQAAAAALEITKRFPNHPRQLFRAACQLAQCIPLVGKGKATLTAQEESQRREYADQAIAALRAAIGHGYRDFDELKKNADLAALRPSKEFQNLLVGAAAKPK
jgi:tetratricopeptide (TPR) repeat protein